MRPISVLVLRLIWPQLCSNNTHLSINIWISSVIDRERKLGPFGCKLYIIWNSICAGLNKRVESDREAGGTAQSGSSANDESARCIARCGWLEGMKCTVKVTTGTAFQLSLGGNVVIKVEQRTKIWMICKQTLAKTRNFSPDCGGFSQAACWFDASLK